MPSVGIRRAARDTDQVIQAGLDAIREQFNVPDEFPADVLAAADEAAKRDPSGSHTDRTSVEFRTLDPESSTDLDQAFAIEVDGDHIVLHYAIADVGFFVDHGGPIDAEAWRRGGTLYIPGGRVPLYPTVLCEGAASLLPDGPRPAVVFTVRIDPDGNAALDGAERAVIHSRAKLAYDSVRPEDLPDGFEELSKRIIAAEERRDAPRVEFPEQELERVADSGAGGGWVLRFDPRLESEDQNAGMSLATNMAVADALLAAKTGLFRVMPEVPERAVGRLRHIAKAFHLEWPSDVPLAHFQRSLPRDDHKANAFLLAVRRASGGATYEPFEPGRKPWHSAMAATYSHATAPLRRLADRYVVEAALAVANGTPVPDEVAKAFDGLPKVMEDYERLGGQVDAAVRDLAEAVLLSGREGEVFDGVVIDEDDRGAVMQITDPAVLVRVRASKVDPGSEIRAKLVRADPAERRVEFERVG